MQTQMNNGSSSRPSLEYYPQAGKAPRRVILDPLPFTIGRVETADLQIDSARVSREHAQIALEEGRFVILDRGSTNGTYVNGQPIERAELADGDTVVVADFELTFIAAAGDRIRRMATQVMTGVAPARGAAAPALADGVDDLRRMHEALLHGIVSFPNERIRTLPDKRDFALYATSPSAEDYVPLPPLGSLSYAVPSHPSARYYELARSLALEAVRREGDDYRLIVDVDIWEIEDNCSLSHHLARLADLLPAGDSLIVAIPADAACDLAEVARFAEDLRAEGISTCYRDFMGGGSQVAQYERLRPDFIELAPSMLRAGLRQNHQRAKLKSVLDACQAMACRPIVAGVDSEEVEEACCEMGFDLMREGESRAAGATPPAPRNFACAV